MSDLISAKRVSLRAAVRHEAIRTALATHGMVAIPDLAEALGVTQVTIREDLKHLEVSGLLTRIRGGAIPTVEAGRPETTLEAAIQERRPEKLAIAAYAASLVQSGQTVILDVGSTTTAVAEALSPTLRDVVVVTNGINIAATLEGRRGVSVIVTGGTLRSLQHSLVAPLGTLLLERLTADLAFLGCSGVDPIRGFTNANIDESEIKQAMLKSSERSIFLADSSKIGQVSSAFIAQIDEASLLVTDRGADPEVLDALRARGLPTEVVNPAADELPVV
jgi:DeoR family transcriptional regulator of aga operon